MTNIGVLVGSLSRDSYSQKIADYLMQHPQMANLIQINYDILPLYNPELENQPPIEWKVFRKVIDEMDALLIVTPEYNLSIPGGLKNALDVASVPTPQAHLYQKPVLVITDSSGMRGGANANAHIQQLLRYLRMNVMNSFITIGQVRQLFSNGGQLTCQSVQDELDSTLTKFINLIKS